MPNSFGIPSEVERRIRARDTRCVYCGKHFVTYSPMDRPTIEHLNEKPPFYWHEGLREEGLAICCGSCNSSRGNKCLQDWFRSRYCTDRPTPIDGDTVAEPIKRYLESLGRDNPARGTADELAWSLAGYGRVTQPTGEPR